MLPGTTQRVILTQKSRQWSCVIDKVEAINVPTLLISGRYDEATPAVVQPFADNIKGARWVRNRAIFRMSKKPENA